MFNALTSNAQSHIQIVRDLIDLHEQAVAKAISGNADHRTRLQLCTVSSCATTLYAIFEWFIESILAEYIDEIPGIYQYASLPTKFRTEYRIGVSHILHRIEGPRYHHLGHENIIRTYHDAITGGTPYRLIPEALVRHEQNLRLEVVNTLMARVQLDGFSSWLDRSREMQTLFIDEGKLYAQLEAELNQFVELRNDAAHGPLESVESYANLRRYCDLVSALVNETAEFVRWAALKKRIDSGASTLKHIGTVTEVLKKAGAFIVLLRSRAQVTIGTQIHIIGASYANSFTVQSLRIDNQDVSGISAIVDQFELGFGLVGRVTRQAEVYTEVSPTTAPPVT